MKIFSTKYALTKGITEHDLEEDGFYPDDDMVRVGDLGWGDYLHGEGKEWHRTYEGAAIRAEELAMKKIASLKKQIARLEAFAESMRAIK